MKVKFYDWKPEDSLKTTEAQREFLAAAAEDGNPAFIAQSLAVVMRARGMPNIGALLDGVAEICRATGGVHRPTGRRTHAPARREAARRATGMG